MTITKTRMLLTLLIILLMKNNLKTTLSFVHWFGKSSNRKPRTLLKRFSSKLKIVMTLITLFLIVFAEAILQKENVSLNTWSLISLITNVQIDENQLDDIHYQVSKSQLYSLLLKTISYLTSKQLKGSILVLLSFVSLLRVRDLVTDG